MKSNDGLSISTTALWTSALPRSCADQRLDKMPPVGSTEKMLYKLQDRSVIYCGTQLLENSTPPSPQLRTKTIAKKEVAVNYGDKYICHSYVIIFRNHFRISKANTWVMFDLLYHLYLWFSFGALHLNTFILPFPGFLKHVPHVPAADGYWFLATRSPRLLTPYFPWEEGRLPVRRAGLGRWNTISSPARDAEMVPEVSRLKLFARCPGITKIQDGTVSQDPHSWAGVGQTVVLHSFITGVNCENVPPTRSSGVPVHVCGL